MDNAISIPLVGPYPFPDREPGRDGAWSRFVVGFENRLVQPAVRCVLDNHRPGYNPVVFRGSTGTGKTHLARGLCLAWKTRYPRRRAIHTDATDFAKELGEAIAVHATDDFRNRHLKAALLVVEDVDRLTAKREAQEDLVRLLDLRLAANTRTVLTGSAAHVPLAPRLQSRLDGGLTILLAAPELAARSLLLKHLAELRQLNLTEAALRLLAEGSPVTVPVLCETLMRLETLVDSDDGAIDTNTVKRLLAVEGSSRRVPLGEIATITARCFALKPSDLRGASQRRAVVTARGVAMYLSRQLTAISLDRIGQFFGGRDHSTVLYGYRKTERLLRQDPAIGRVVQQVKEELATQKKNAHAS